MRHADAEKLLTAAFVHSGLRDLDKLVFRGHLAIMEPDERARTRIAQVEDAAWLSGRV